MSIQKITVFECDTCKREIELELEDKRPYPSRCTITNKCPGLLTAKAFKRARSELFPPIVYGLEDYIQRGTSQAASETLVEPELISLMAGKSKMALAALTVDGAHFVEDTLDTDGVTVISNTTLFANPADPASSGYLDYASSASIAIYLELFELGDANTNFTEYYFVGNGLTQEISGADDSQAQLLLRFDLADTIRVIVNGVELVRDVTFTASLLNTGVYAIKFTPLLTNALNIIRVLIYSNPTDISNPNSENIRVLKFVGQSDIDTSRSDSAWGDALGVNIGSGDFSILQPWLDRLVLTCDDFSVLSLNNRYQIRGLYVISPIYSNNRFYLSPTHIHILFADSPFSFVDKSIDVTLNIKKAIDEKAQLEFLQTPLNDSALQTAKTNLTNLIKITKTKSAASIVNTVDDVNYQNSNISSSYIIGYV